MDDNRAGIDLSIGKGDIIIVNGSPGIGSTWFSLDLCHKICKWINVQAVYYEGGMSHQEIIKRNEFLKSGEEQSAEIRSFDRIFMEEKTFPTFRDCRFVDRCETELERGKFGLIVYDNTTTLFGHSETGKNLSNPDILRRIITLRQKDIIQIFIQSDHKGLIQESYADLVLKLGSVKDSVNLTLKVSIMKSRNILPNKQTVFSAELRSDENGKYQFDYAEYSDDVKLTVLVKILNGETQKNIAEETDIDQATVSRWLKQFERKGLIRRKGRKTNLTDAGIKWLKSNTEVLKQNGICLCPAGI